MNKKVLIPASTFLRVEGAASEGITVDGGDLRKAVQTLVVENGAGKESVRLRV